MSSPATFVEISMEELSGAAYTRDPEKNFKGQQLISVEASAGGVVDLRDWVQNNFDEFMQHIQVLPAKARDLLLSRYCLNKAYEQLKRIFQMHLTANNLCGVSLATKALGAAIIFQGSPSRTTIERLTTLAGVQESASLIFDCINDHSVSRTQSMQLHRNIVTLINHKHEQVQALGYLLLSWVKFGPTQKPTSFSIKIPRACGRFMQSLPIVPEALFVPQGS